MSETDYCADFKRPPGSKVTLAATVGRGGWLIGQEPEEPPHASTSDSRPVDGVDGNGRVALPSPFFFSLLLKREKCRPPVNHETQVVIR
jgi:hypothetical protein